MIERQVTRDNKKVKILLRNKKIMTVMSKLNFKVD